MNASEARIFLKNSRLQFGDAKQIEAVHAIEAYEAALELEQKGADINCTCPQCDGEGTITCPQCDGQGETDGDIEKTDASVLRKQILQVA